MTYAAHHQGWRNDSRDGGTRLWRPPRKRVLKCLQGPKTTYTTIAIAEKQSKRGKKGPFLLYIGPPGSHPGSEINGARRGRSLPVPPVSPAMRITRSGDRSGTRVPFVTDGRCLACRYDLTYELRTWTDTRQLEVWFKEDIVRSCPITTTEQRRDKSGLPDQDIGLMTE